MQLTTAFISEKESTHHEKVVKLNLSEQGISSIGNLTRCPSLTTLNLSSNGLTNDALAGLSTLPQLKQLDLSSNGLNSFDGLESLCNLRILTVSNNQLTSLTVHLEQLKSLRALIAKGNQIKQIKHLDQCTQLTTLILSDNNIKSVPKLASLTRLTKLSLGRNPITVFPNLEVHIYLKELRLGGCKISRVTEKVKSAKSLEIVDLSNNTIRQYEDIVHLAGLDKLINLTLQGNPVSDLAGYQERILALIPTLRIFDLVRFDPKFLKRKEQREVLGQKRKLNEVETNQQTDENSKSELQIPSNINGVLKNQLTKTQKLEGREKRIAKSSQDKSKITLTQGKHKVTTQHPKFSSTMSLSTTDAPAVVTKQKVLDSGKTIVQPAATEVALEENEAHKRSGVVAIQEIKQKSYTQVHPFDPQEFAGDDNLSVSSGWD